jgi:hypothetical protein
VARVARWREWSQWFPIVFIVCLLVGGGVEGQSLRDPAAVDD